MGGVIRSLALLSCLLLVRCNGGGVADSGSPPADGGFAADVGFAADLGFAADSGAPDDSGFPSDSGAPADSGFPSDSGLSAEDGGSDSGFPSDSGVPADDSGLPSDSGAALEDSGFPSDSGGSVDASALDATDDEAGIDSGLLADAGSGAADAADAGPYDGPRTDAGLGFCTSNSDCWTGESCEFATMDYVATSTALKICKVLEDTSMRGYPCDPQAPQYCSEFGDFCSATLGHYGTPECRHGNYSEAYCEPGRERLCYDAAKSCFADIAFIPNIVPFFCASPCVTSEDCPPNQACSSFDGSGTSTTFPNAVEPRYCAAPSCDCGSRATYCRDSVCTLPATSNTCPDGTYQSFNRMQNWDCGCLPGATLAECIPPTCVTDQDCGGRMSSCALGACIRMPCAGDQDCAPGKICGILGAPGRSAREGPQRYCMTPGPVALGGICQEGADCASGQCYAGSCVVPCARNSDCGGEECLVGPIVPSDPPFCSARLHCGNCRPDEYCSAWRECLRP